MRQFVTLAAARSPITPCWDALPMNVQLLMTALALLTVTRDMLGPVLDVQASLNPANVRPSSLTAASSRSALYFVGFPVHCA